MAAWRWDKTSQPAFKSPTKEELSVVRIFGQLSQEVLVSASKKGRLMLYRLATGSLIAEVENAHYLAIEDMDISSYNGNGQHEGDLLITGGQDSKVKVWKLASLLSQ